MAKKKQSKKKVRSIYDSYGYAVVNGTKQYGRYESDGDEDEPVFVGYGNYIGVESVLTDIDGGSPILTLAYITTENGKGSVNITRELLGQKKQLQALLLKCNADAYDASISTLMNCLYVSERKASRGQCFHRTGWIVEDVGTEGESLSFKGYSLVSNTPGEEIAYVGSYDLTSKGTFDAWLDILEEWVMGRPQLEIAVLIGLSPIISSEWGARNLVFHFMGDSGSGKTTSAMLALSTVGCPNPSETAKYLGADGKPLRSLLSSWKSTSNALTAKLDGLDGTLMVYDELSKIEDINVIGSVIYTLSDGADKDRMMNSTEMQSTSLIKTNILSVGEESLLEKSSNQNSGLNVRVCEISTTFTYSAKQAEAINAGCSANYGHAAMMFAQYIVDNMTYAEVAELREKNLTEYTEALEDAGCPSPTIRRLAEFGAILLTVADIADEALGIEFSRDDIVEFLVDQQVNADSNSDIGARAHEALRGYVNSNIANFITDNSNEWKKSIPCLGKVVYIPNGGMEVNINASEFPGIMKKLGFNNSGLILKKFKAAGNLDYEQGKTYRKRQITKAGGTVRVNVVKFT